MNKLDLGFDNLLEKFVLLAVFFFPIMILLVKSGGTTIFGLTALLSLFVFFKKGIKENFSREEKLFFYSCALIFLMAMFVSLLAGFDKDAWKPASRMLNLMLAIPLYFLFKQYLRKENIVWWGLFVGVVLCGSVAIYEINIGGLYGFYGQGPVPRVGAATNAILFGDLSLAMMSMLVIAATTLKQINYKIIFVLLIVISFGLAATLLSHSRGGWLLLPLLVVMIGWQLKSRISTKSLTIAVLAVPLIAVVMYLIPGTGLQQRVDKTFENIQKYSQGTGDKTSVGLRLEMWKTSWLLFKQEPITGVGWGNYQENAQELIAQKQASPYSAKWDNPHSQYFSVMAAGGLLMLFAFLNFFMVPMIQFKRLLVFNDVRVRSYALAGIVLILGYMVFALTESIFERSIPTVFLSFYMALLFALANRNKQQKTLDVMPRKKKLSVIIIAFNEADRIGECLASVSGWADEVVLFDNGSTDGTIEIAKKYTDKVFVTDWPGYGKQKQRALENAQYEWVLSLDADEKLTPELRSEIDTALSSESNNVAYKIPLALILYNKRLDFGLYTRDHLRLFKREGARFTDATVHESIVIQKGNVGLLRERFLHYSYRDLKHAVEKFNQNAWLWGTERFAKGKRAFWFSAIIHAIWKFISGYIIRLGFLDGFRGLIMAVHAAMYTFNKYAVLWTLNLQEKNND